jgi:ketosteroid isomerase-like protein
VSQENIDVVLASIDALNAGDLDAQIATYAPDAVIVFDPAGAGNMVLPDHLVGREPLRRELKPWYEALGFWYTPSEVRAVGDDQVLCRGKLGGTGVASGIEVHDSVSTLFTLHDGLITRLEFYREHDDALKAAGLEE